MGIKSIRKGKVGEREFINLLKDYLGDDAIKRNLDQTRDGGHDVIGIDGWTIEIKRAAKPNLTAWWNQAVEQAIGNGEPVLAYRIDRRPWRVILSIGSIHPEIPSFGYDLDYCVEMSVLAFCSIVRERMEEINDDDTSNIRYDAGAQERFWNQGRP